MDRDELVRLVMEVVRARIPAGDARVGPDSMLGGEGLGLDSIGVLDLVLELERRCGVVLRQECLSAADLETPASLAAYIARVSGG